MNDTLHNLVDDIWYGRHPARLALLPFSWLYRGVFALRRTVYESRLLNVYRAPVPVIVVGNITVGGTGKTPLVIWIARKLQEYGFKPGIVARGYRGAARHWPQQVRADSDPIAVGDEALVLARRTGLPVAVGPQRSADIAALLKHAGVDIIVCDDGLQHYGMARDLEIAVLDGVRRYGNGACLPAGPLREPTTRLTTVDLLVTNGLAARGEFAMRYLATAMHRVGQVDDKVSFADFADKEVHAVAAIGNPDSFFALLKRNGFRVKQHVFPDHHLFTREELTFGDDLAVIMTEKDAVKCEHFTDLRLWYVPIDVELPDVFERRFKMLLQEVFDGQKAA